MSPLEHLQRPVFTAQVNLCFSDGFWGGLLFGSPLIRSIFPAMVVPWPRNPAPPPLILTHLLFSKSNLLIQRADSL